MPPTTNSFEEHLVKELVKLMEAFLLDNYGSVAEVLPGQEKDVEVSPRVVVSATSMIEAIFNTGIYEATVEFTARINLDAEGATDQSNADSIGELYGAIMDFVQQPELKQQLIATGKLRIQGIVLEDARLDTVDDRRWWKGCNVKFYGYATPG